MQKLVELKKESLLNLNIPISPFTIYNWWKNGKHLDLRVKIGGRVFLNVSRFYKKFGLDEVIDEDFEVKKVNNSNKN